MRCKLDSTENPRSFVKYPTPLKKDNFHTYIKILYIATVTEEEEGTGIASDVVKVKGEDPATPGLLP